MRWKWRGKPLILRIQTQVEIVPCGHYCSMPLSQDNDPPPYRLDAQTSDATRNIQSQVTLPSGDVDIARLIADRSGAPIAAITTVIYAAAYAVPKEKIPWTVTYIAKCISNAMKATIALPQRDKEIASAAIVTAITIACNISASVLPRSIVGGMTDEEQAMAASIADAFETVNPLSKETAQDWIRCSITSFTFSMKDVPIKDIAAVTAALIAAVAKSVKTVAEAPAELQTPLAQTYISFINELTDTENNGRAFTLPNTT